MILHNVGMTIIDTGPHPVVLLYRNKISLREQKNRININIEYWQYYIVLLIIMQ